MVAFLTQKKDFKAKMDEKICGILPISCYLGWAAPLEPPLERPLELLSKRS